MMKFQLTVHMDNDAFKGDDRGATELQRILKVVTRNIGVHGIQVVTMPVQDVNGNPAGKYRLTENAADLVEDTI
jgi:hypothetical protein